MMIVGAILTTFQASEPRSNTRAHIILFTQLHTKRYLFNPYVCITRKGGQVALKRSRVILLIIVMMVAINQSVTSNTILSRKNDFVFALSDSTGPEFLDVGNRSGDYFSSTDPVNATLDLLVVVRDPDGIDTVIGSYKNRSESIWKNVTMEVYGDIGNNTFLYSAKPLNFTLDNEHRLEVWYVKYYANDTLGNWNVSELVSISKYLLPSGSQPDYSIVIVVAIGIVIIMAGVVYMKRRSV